MFISDKNLLAELDYLKSINKITSKMEAYQVMGIDRQRVSNIRNQHKEGMQGYHFSAEHIRKFCETYGVDANKILGLKEYNSDIKR